MTVQLTEHQAQALREALHESLRIAVAYRENIADEDSIALLQDLRDVCHLLGIHDQTADARTPVAES